MNFNNDKLMLNERMHDFNHNEISNTNFNRLINSGIPNFNENGNLTNPALIYSNSPSSQNIQPNFNIPLLPINGLPMNNMANNLHLLPNLNGVNKIPTFPPNNIPPIIRKIMFQQKLKINPPVNTKTNTIYIKNLNEKINETKLKSELKELFISVGKIDEIKCLKNFRAKGQAFISFSNDNEAENAIKKFNGVTFLGKMMLIDFAKSKIDKSFENYSEEEKNKFLNAKIVRKIKKDDFYKSLKIKEMNNINIEINKIKSINPLDTFNPSSLLPLNNSNNNDNKFVDALDKNLDILNSKNIDNLNKNFENIKPTFIDSHKNESKMLSLKRSIHEIKEAIEDLGFKATHKLFVSGFSEGTTEKDILDIFKNEIGLVNLRYIPEKDQCFIEFDNDIYASEALLNNKDKIINGEEINISFAKILK